MDNALQVIMPLVLLSIRPVTVLLHEMGHAIPAFLFTRSEKIEVFVGSFGDMNNVLHFKLQKFRFYLKYNPLDWTHGLCRYDKPPKKNFFGYLITLSGPLASFTLAAGLLFTVVYFDLRGYIEFIALIFMASAVFDLWWNLTPSGKPIELYDGTITYNDGHSLVTKWRMRKVHRHLELIYLHTDKGEIEKAVFYADKIAEGDKQSSYLSEVLAFIYLEAGAYDKAIGVIDAAKERDEATCTLHWYEGDAYRLKGMLTEALQAYNKTEEEFKVVNFYLKRGFLFIQMNRYEEALADYERAVQVNDRSADSLYNLGYVLVYLGRTTEALPYIEKAIELREDFALAYSSPGAGWATGKTG
jgi:tetratricopeptide (TPR) repeat protein